MTAAGMHTLVIGGGVIGLAQAYELALRGHEVTVLEARELGEGASGINAGWVVPAMASPVPAPGVVRQALRWMTRPDSPLLVRPALDAGYLRFLLGMWRHSTTRAFRAGFAAQVRLASATLALLDEYRAHGIEFEVHRDGVLLAFVSKEKFEHHRHDLSVPGGAGIVPQTLTGDELRDVEPALGGAVVGGVRFPGQWHVDPRSLVEGLRSGCEALGVRVVTGAPVSGFGCTDGRVLAAVVSGQYVPADAFVLAAGAWTRSLCASLGVSVPIHPGKGYAIDLTPAPVSLRSMLYLAEAKVAMTPFDGRLRLAGTMELGRIDERIDRVRVAAVGRAPAGYLRRWQIPPGPLAVGAGVRPMTPDGLPLIGRIPGFANAYVTSGHGMMGVTLAPASARALTAVISGSQAPAELHPFDPSRVGRIRRRPRTGRIPLAPQRVTMPTP